MKTTVLLIYPVSWRRVASAVLFLLLNLPVGDQALAASTASEQANVDVMIRQLNAVEAVARRSAELPSDGSSRYRLDYSRLAADIARIRQGLQDYLAPSRAQPRDVTELSGQYQRERAQP
ncbi:type III effector Hop protein [Pseudomonas oryzihabitans]|nr:type III effector Hop protein [Pseudomonas psychrotolerans]KTT40016.1 type III effector Hop protein [Pseudomonas psychrotolerans]KTT43804.1 type III effector Hop protein [Pseudomonas psychrotolerans]KTT64540.1 type III effector Hop protein [Pseudomonas psychrotolerans]